MIAALLPAISGAYLAYSIGSAIAQLDELQRRIQLEAIGIGYRSIDLRAAGPGGHSPGELDVRTPGDDPAVGGG